MGLDTVEIIMSVEEAFGIEFPDDAAADILTTQELIDFVYKNVRHNAADQRVCLSQRAFYRIRRQLREKLDLPRENLRPKTKWADIVPLDSRREIWVELSRSADFAAYVPTLERPPLLLSMIAFGPLLTGGAVFAALAAASVPAAGIAALATGIGTVWLALASTRHKRIYFGSNVTTLGDTANAMALHRAAYLRAGLGWTRDEVRTIVRKIMIDHLGLEDTFSDHARIVDDLGSD